MFPAGIMVGPPTWASKPEGTGGGPALEGDAYTRFARDEDVDVEGGRNASFPTDMFAI